RQRRGAAAQGTVIDRSRALGRRAERAGQVFASSAQRPGGPAAARPVSTWRGRGAGGVVRPGAILAESEANCPCQSAVAEGPEGSQILRAAPGAVPKADRGAMAGGGQYPGAPQGYACLSSPESSSLGITNDPFRAPQEN